MRETRLPGNAGAVRSRARVWRQRAATIAVGSLAMVMGYGVVFGHNGLTAFASKRREAKALQLQMQRLQQENERLHGHVDRLQTDPSAIEHEARQQFHYTRPGEVIYTLPVGKPATAAQ
jgi:cell division protein FtsB